MYSVIGPDGQTYGPVEMDTLKVWCSQGRINADTRVVDPIDGSVRPASDLPEVAQHIRPPAVPRPYPPAYQTFGAPNFSNSMALSYPRIAYVDAPPKSKLLAIVLAFFFGAFGIHRFYLGDNSYGLTMLLITILSFGTLAIITGLWSVIDIVLIATGNMKEKSGRDLTWP